MQPSNNVGNFFGIKVSQPNVNVARAGDNQLLYKSDYSTDTFYDNAGNARVLLGTLPDSSYGLWVSAPGVNAANADPATPGQLIFNSNEDIFTIIETGTANIPAKTLSANSTQFIGIDPIPHNLGYAPIVQVYAQVPIEVIYGSGGTNILSTDTYTLLPITSSSQAGVLIANTIYDFPNTNASSILIYSTQDNQNIYVSGYYTTNSGGSCTFPAVPLKYYIIRESVQS